MEPDLDKAREYAQRQTRKKEVRCIEKDSIMLEHKHL